ncbi:FAD-dependent monooxygenase [Rhizobium pusense]|uniref:Monooxygenase n=3 Tax=Agrobacterium TaxID=357 RepID=A0A6H0ZIX8_9HYPH|nr:MULTISPECIES: FAD-dependent monooxygenase [Rhizobium/Agrobacterium group]QCM13574.1 monooxygenase [Agrobacterium tumefaciens]KNY31464.1 monooxygenase [Agrobacterium sp. SUL3]MCD4663491.1 FAD-dependent monooxygenase [Agrobacterium sp.]MDH0912513.1 FAD-dependent monooxygenase [Agrobacterium pusense]MDH1098870.1 FAD-dependent monooxygenase [Agrobacterium pusense]
MRPAGRSETESLYFHYPYFDAPGKEARDAKRVIKVAIVGAGPVGMTAALTLASQGVSSVVFDNKSTFNDGSRAICVARPSYYILGRLGIAAPFVEKALPWTTGRSFYRGTQILEFKMPDSENEKFRPMYNIQQQYIEQFLWEAIKANPLIETRWQSSVDEIENAEDGLRLTIKDPDGIYSVDAEWVLACDGARSSIRAKRGLRLRGQNFEGRYVIADVQMDHDFPTIRRALFDPRCRPGGTVLIHRQPENIWRIDYQLEGHEETEEAIKEEAIRAGVQAVLDEIGHSGPWELEWWSIYSANTLALDDYRDGRVFFVGDSAHIVPIFGVRGLNNGLADAANIGWKLGWVINQKAGAALLDTYSPERRGATLDVFANASKTARFMTPGTYGWRLMRDAALSLALTHSFAGALANPRQMTAYTYNGSKVIISDDGDFTAGPVAGSAFQDVRLDDGYLSERLGNGFTVLCFDEKLAAQLDAAIAPDADITILSFSCCSPVAEAYGAVNGTVYLIRPDTHITGRWREPKLATVLGAYCVATCQQGAL